MGRGDDALLAKAVGPCDVLPHVREPVQAAIHRQMAKDATKVADVFVKALRQHKSVGQAQRVLKYVALCGGCEDDRFSARIAKHRDVLDTFADYPVDDPVYGAAMKRELQRAVCNAFEACGIPVCAVEERGAHYWMPEPEEAGANPLHVPLLEQDVTPSLPLLEQDAAVPAIAIEFATFLNVGAVSSPVAVDAGGRRVPRRLDQKNGLDQSGHSRSSSRSSSGSPEPSARRGKDLLRTGSNLSGSSTGSAKFLCPRRRGTGLTPETQCLHPQLAASSSLLTRSDVPRTSSNLSSSSRMKDSAKHAPPRRRGAGVTPETQGLLGVPPSLPGSVRPTITLSDL
eukprot:TRINITY_DN6206_c0_g2_i12.p1 TRINITY_DN6206_c0_g2~~TRINITY_DN6206_c0_g2_i12.p1  ORF type:complete len:341 (+),score=50.66 TRINITY_DN6206_c0_g2_i12:56-1078(+)